MAAIDTFLMVIGDLAAGVAAIAAVTALRYARQTVLEARAERTAAEQARLTRRVEWVGEAVEHIDRLAEDDLRDRPVGQTWQRGRQLLAQGLVGLDGRLPRTAQLVSCADAYSARSITVVARDEVAAELARLARSQAVQPGQDKAESDGSNQRRPTRQWDPGAWWRPVLSRHERVSGQHHRPASRAAHRPAGATRSRSS